ncbi:MAG: hypothetical protein QOH06_4558 [Acidobacteriota bacterium]|jgi:hypothetical protein|nr:hypothetical protein [Acidobacteriota bacterium]
MAKRVFISFAIEDANFRGLLVGQAKNDRTPFEFVNMAVKEPWDEKWKTQCRTRIKGCDGMIALVSKHTSIATGQLWEIKCAREEKVPVRGVYVSSDQRPTSLPKELEGVRVVNWSWDNIKSFIDSL